MNLWATRTSALAYLQDEKPAQLQVLSHTFSIIDSAVDGYEAYAQVDNYSKVCALTLVKAKNLAIGSYSLVLDGLGQEAGALLRPFVEYVELLSYFRKFPEEAENALSNHLPSAGQRAKAIDGSYKNLREYLNVHASHSSYSSYSLSHLVEVDSERLKKLQPFVPAALERNVCHFAIQLYFAAREAVLGLALLEGSHFEVLATETDNLKVFLISTFDLGDDI